MENKQQIEKVMEMFSSATGLTAVYVDIDGKEISDDDQFPPVCQIIRQVPHLRKHCQTCAKCGGFETMKNGQPCMYRCHAGLVDFAVPVKSQENTLYGFIISGQVR
ncbi:PocR ligand-binding domain-containing protein, partial [Heyndrickxia coagulans]|nr:PocR ligand-binding domain-containing protein [Heyndrickxia coagulans]